MTDDPIDRLITTMATLARRLVAVERRLELLSGRLETAASIDRINRRLDELEAESKAAEARPAPTKPLQLVAP